MSKERLEEIEKRVFSRTFHTGLEVDMITIPERDYIYLKNKLNECGKLTDVLEDRNIRLDYLEDVYKKLIKQNKRYREAIMKAKKELLNINGGKETRPFTVYGILNEALEGEEE